MRKNTKLKFYLGMIPALLGWAALMLVLWGFVFLRLDDTSADHKLVIYADCDIADARELMIQLEDTCGITSESKYAFGDAEIRKIKLFSTSFFSALSDPLKDGDLFIITEEHLGELKDSFAPLSDGVLGAENIYEGIGILFADPETEHFPFDHYFLYDQTQRYYLCLNAKSLHVGNQDGAALALASIFLNSD